MSVSLATRGMISGSGDGAGGGGPSDTEAPQIVIISPAPGSTLGPGTRLKFRMMDNEGIRRALPSIKYMILVGGVYKPRYEVIHDGEEFTADFVGTRTGVTVGDLAGFEYDIKRIGGWPAAPTLVPFMWDTSGNEPE